MSVSAPDPCGSTASLAEEFRRARADGARRRAAVAAGLCGAILLAAAVGWSQSGTAGVGQGGNAYVAYAPANPIAALFDGMFRRPPPQRAALPPTNLPPLFAPPPTPTRTDARTDPRRMLPAGAPRPQAAVPAPKLVCVRLCDGYFFPAPTNARTGGGDAACAAMCPGAPTRQYVMRDDNVMNAVASRTRTPYARLPVALQYTKAHEPTCSCGAIEPTDVIATDPTLRRGDRFMTATGFVIYEGPGGRRTTARDFTPLPNARSVSWNERRLLMAMERASGVSRAASPAGMRANHMADASRPAAVR